MTDYIRGVRQLKAIFYFVEQLWLVIIGRDSRGLDEEEKKFVVWSGMEFRKHRLRSVIRELEIITGFARPYKIVFSPMFWESLRNMGVVEEDIEEMKRRLEK